MDEQTRSAIQSLLDLTRSNMAQIVRLQALNAIQSHALMALVSRSDLTGSPPEVIDAYKKTRLTALSMIEMADERGDFDAILDLVDSKFLKGS